MAFKIAGSMAFKDAYAAADPVLLEPIMLLEATVPDDSVGAVNGDLNSRRGRLLGMEPRGGMTTIRAEVPMAEFLTYSQSLTSLTGGRGDYAMSFLRYEEVPSHVSQKIVDETKRRARGGEGVVDASRTERLMLIRRQEEFRVCAVCERTILQGERVGALQPRRGARSGWTSARSASRSRTSTAGSKEGSPTQPIVAEAPRSGGSGSVGLGPARVARPPSRSPSCPSRCCGGSPRRSSTLVEAAELFNKSPYSRTIAGVAKSLGEARVSMIPLSGTIPEIVITIAWEISWYQYRVVFELVAAGAPRGARPGPRRARRALHGTGTRASTRDRLRPDIPRF